MFRHGVAKRKLSAPQIIKLYAKRWTIEPSFRDSKDLRFGMGMSALTEATLNE